ncbi:hypothetical protein ABWH96_17865 [Marivirga tractuosa]|uniref:hypothetical protein n=1 Tax=Marivirga tractuosa TaxID=1006 RepID=UPI0035CF887E
MNLGTLLKLKAHRPEQIIKELYELVKMEAHKEKPDLPYLSIGLSGGNILSGYLLNYNFENEEVLLGSFIEGKSELKYCSSLSVQSIEVHKANNWLHALSDGQLEFIPRADDVPSSLELKRKLNDAQAVLSQRKINLEFDLSALNTDLEQFYAKIFMKMVVEVIKEISSTDLGKQALEKSISLLKLSLGKENKLSLEENLLSVEFKIDKAPQMAWKARALQEAIEEKL